MNPTPADKQITFPQAKINLGLFVARRREDGYHILQTLFYPIDWRDALEIVPLPPMERHPQSGEEISTVGQCRMVQTGIQIDGDPEANLCVKAYRRLQRLFPDMPGVSIHLEKRVPFGAGLGGGSSDGAHTLLLLRALFELPISDEQLEKEAAALGADCAFFCRCGTTYNTSNNGGRMEAQYCEGIGHELEAHALSLKGYYLVVVKPPFGVSTKEAYGGVRPIEPAIALKDLLTRPIAEWRASVVNDFEKSVFPLHPELAEAKQTLYDHGALYASMSGSGSALFGIFDKEPEQASAWFGADYQVHVHQALV